MAGAERSYELFAAIVVAGNDEDRHRQPGEAGVDNRIFLFEPAVREVAADHDAIGPRVQLQHRVDGVVKHRVGIDVAVSELAARSRVEIAQLGYDEHRIPSPEECGRRMAAAAIDDPMFKNSSSRHCFP